MARRGRPPQQRPRQSATKSVPSVAPAPAPLPPPAATPPVATPSRRPAAPRVTRSAAPFWFDFAVPWEKILAARVALFALLAIDAILQIAHAPRYGTGFNVAQLPGFGAIAPGRAGYEVGQLLDAYLLGLAAFGVATRVTVPLAAAIYGWLYFGSQLDSYQHHYLVFMILVIASFVPWQRPAGGSGAPPVRSWALRLLLVQLGIVYLWAAISKLDAAWLDGRTLALQMQGGVRTLIDRTIGMKGASILVVITELGLAATVWNRRAWIVVAPLGIAFHAGIIATGLEIGLFAYLMIGLYLLVIPDGIYRFLATDAAPGPARRLLERPSWIALGLAAGAGIGIASLVRLEHALACGVVATAVPVGIAALSLRRGTAPVVAVALGHVAALLLWVAVDRGSSTAVDYYRFWGGSQRRFGEPAVAEHAYRRLIAIAPSDGNGHYQLGRVLLAADRSDEGLASLRAAQRLEPTRARSFLAEARWLARAGRVAEAIEKAKQGATAEPASAEARSLADALAKPATPGAAPPDPGDAP